MAVALADLRDFHTAEDVAQAAFLSAYRRLASLRDGTRFGPWLLQIVRREVVNAVRSNRRVVATVPSVEGHPAVSWPPTSETLQDDLLALVARLPQRERMLVGLRYFDGKSMSEISQFTGRPIGSVTKQLSCALARLRAGARRKHHDFAHAGRSPRVVGSELAPTALARRAGACRSGFSSRACGRRERCRLQTPSETSALARRCFAGRRVGRRGAARIELDALAANHLGRRGRCHRCQAVVARCAATMARKCGCRTPREFGRTNPAGVSCFGMRGKTSNMNIVLVGRKWLNTRWPLASSIAS